MVNKESLGSFSYFCSQKKEVDFDDNLRCLLHSVVSCEDCDLSCITGSFPPIVSAFSHSPYSFVMAVEFYDLFGPMKRMFDYKGSSYYCPDVISFIMLNIVCAEIKKGNDGGCDGYRFYRCVNLEKGLRKYSKYWYYHVVNALRPENFYRFYEKPPKKRDICDLSYVRKIASMRLGCPIRNLVPVIPRDVRICDISAPGSVYEGEYYASYSNNEIIVADDLCIGSLFRGGIEFDYNLNDDVLRDD